VAISYYQDKKSDKCCKKLELVQIVRGNKDRGFDPNWTVDWVPGGEPYPYYPGESHGSGSGYVGMWDAPGARWHNVRQYWQEFETCALCVNSPNASVLGCVRWGHAFNRIGRAWDYGDGKGQAALDPSWAFMNAINGIKFP
jgi:hypothetical protein